MAWCDRIIGPDTAEAGAGARTDGGAIDVAEPVADEETDVMIAAAADNWIGLGLAVLLTIYLVVVLVRPEKF